jgi:hypothetical protein
MEVLKSEANCVPCAGLDAWEDTWHGGLEQKTLGRVLMCSRALACSNCKGGARCPLVPERWDIICPSLLVPHFPITFSKMCRSENEMWKYPCLDSPPGFQKLALFDYMSVLFPTKGATSLHDVWTGPRLISTARRLGQVRELFNLPDRSSPILFIYCECAFLPKSPRTVFHVFSVFGIWNTAKQCTWTFGVH